MHDDRPANLNPGRWRSGLMEWRSHAPSGRADGTYEIEKYEWESMERKLLFSGPSLYMPWITHMLFVDLNYNFSCQEFDRLLCSSSVKRCRESTIGMFQIKNALRCLA